MATGEFFSAGPAPQGERGRAIPPAGEGGYDECWYPVARSDEVASGGVLGRPFLDGRVVVYRGESGRPAAASAYCRHLGADLSVGEVVGERLRCRFHHWCYDASGSCVEIPSGDAIPKGTQLYSYPVAEALGLIWVYNGGEPDTRVPHFARPNAELVFRVADAKAHPVDPWALLTNSVDFQHLRVVHGLQVEVDYDAVEFEAKGLHYDVRFEDPSLGAFEQYVEVFGTNVIALSGTLAGAPLMTMFAGVPQPDASTRGFVVTATTADSAGPGPPPAQLLEMGEQFFLGLIEEDTLIMNTIRFRLDKVVPADRVLGRFIDYVRGFPRAHPSAEFIR